LKAKCIFYHTNSKSIIAIIFINCSVASEPIFVGRLEPFHFQKWDGFHIILPIRAVPLFTRRYKMPYIVPDAPIGWPKNGRPPKGGGTFALALFFQRLFFVCCCITDSTYRHILLLRSFFCFQLVLGLAPTFNLNIRTVWTWNPCSPYTVVTLVALALLIFINI